MAKNIEHGLVLASASLSRARILKDMGVAFRVSPGQVDETPQKQEIPRDYVCRLAKMKALEGAERCPGTFVLGADTCVAVGRRILGKPSHTEESRKQIMLLSGRSHRVMTALALYTPTTGKVSVRFCETHVKMNVLEEKEIEDFLCSKDWEGVCVYRIEGFISRFVRCLNGLPTTIQGLPIFDTYQLLKGHGLV